MGAPVTAFERSHLSEPINHVIDEWLAGRLDRRTFVRLATTVGLGLPLALAMAPDPASAARTRRTTRPATTTTIPPGSVLRVPVTTDTRINDPWNATPSELVTVGLLGAYLVRCSDAHVLTPAVARSWASDDAATEWTFTLTPGLRFQNGRRLEAADVVASFRAMLDPAAPTLAAVALRGIVTAAGVQRVNPTTVRFKLTTPTAAFPVLVSDANPGAVILSEGRPAPAGQWFVSAGPWQPASETSLRFVRFADSPERPLSGVRTVLLSVDDPVSAFTENRADLATELTADVVAGASAAALRASGEAAVLTAATSEHVQLHLRTTNSVLADARLRRAIAAVADRVALRALLGDQAEPVDDVPLSPSLAWSPPRPVPVRDLALARRLLRDAGKRRGFALTLASDASTLSAGMAASLQASLGEVGIALTHAPSEQYAEQTWLASQAGLTRFAHRPNPAALLAATVSSDGPWNASKYRNTDVDAAVRTVSTSLDLDAQRRAAGVVANQLLADRPLVVPFFVRRLALVRRGFEAMRFTSSGLVLL